MSKSKPKPKHALARYFALHKAGLSNGSFFRVRGPKTCAQFINGDFMGNVGTLPETYAGQQLVEFKQEEAEKLIPKVCL